MSIPVVKKNLSINIQLAQIHSFFYHKNVKTTSVFCFSPLPMKVNQV